MRRVFQIALGVLFLPACIVQTVAFYRSLKTLQTVGDERYFVYGAFLYFLMHTLVARPVTLYTWAHEAVHALFAVAFGGKVTAFRVSNQGGETQATKSNVVIELAPYFVPLYALAFCASEFVAVRMFGAETLRDLFFLLIGFSLTLHIVMTVDFLKTKQSDLLKLGTPLSVELIYVVNLLVTVFVLGFIFPEVSPGAYFLRALDATQEAYQGIFRQLFLIR